jgi:hypothetical protein
MKFRKKGLLVVHLHTSIMPPLLSIFEVAPQRMPLEADY